ncbi:MAG: DALR anticodon-binding domain-containing protein, partial [Flavobacteriales bacterium]
GMVELPEGKMKSREGTVVDADDLLEEMEATAADLANEQGKLSELSEAEKSEAFKMIGHGALKYFLLKVDPRKGMKFDPKESIDFLGNTGPFIQFNYVRTRALLRKSGGISEAEFPTELHPSEKLLIKKLYDFETVITEAANSYDPAGLANYTFELAKEFSSFYNQCPILSAEDKISLNFRLQLASKTGDVIKQAMGLLGINMPERM